MDARGAKRFDWPMVQRLTGACDRCGLSEWRGEPLSMDLHHVNGDRYDNRIENLQLLCPNCHSQTENFAGRNRIGKAR